MGSPSPRHRWPFRSREGAVRVTDASGTVRVESGDKSIATAAYASGTVTITGVKAGQTKVKVSDSKGSVSVAVTVNGTTTSRRRRIEQPAVARPRSNDLGMPARTWTTRSSASCRRSTSCTRRSCKTGTASANRGFCQCRSRCVLQRDIELVDRRARLDQYDEQPVSFRRQEQLLAGNAAAERQRRDSGRSRVPLALPGAVLDLFAPIPGETGLRSRSGGAACACAGTTADACAGQRAAEIRALRCRRSVLRNFPFGAKVAGATGSPPTASRSCRSTTRAARTPTR